MATDSIIRVTHREREDTVEKLRSAYAAGCLDDGELEERSSLAYAAKARGQLAGVVADLPPAPQGEVTDSTAGLRPTGDWGDRARRALGRGCWLMLAAVGTWLLAAMASGITAVPLIFLWLVSIRLCERSMHRHAVWQDRPRACPVVSESPPGALGTPAGPLPWTAPDTRVS